MIPPKLPAKHADLLAEAIDNGGVLYGTSNPYWRVLLDRLVRLGLMTCVRSYAHDTYRVTPHGYATHATEAGLKEALR
jgi:hypothetical protein